MEKITRKTTIGDLVNQHPETGEVLFNLGLHCLGCHAASFETLEEGLKAHGKSEKEIEEAIKKLNEVVKEKNK